MSVTVMVHGPDVVAVACQHVHERVFALSRNREIIRGARRVRRAVHQEHDWPRRFAWAGCADALAPKVKFHVAFFRPIVLVPDFFAGRRRLRLRSGEKTEQASADADTGALQHRAAGQGTFELTHGVSSNRPWLSHAPLPYNLTNCRGSRQSTRAGE